MKNLAKLLDHHPKIILEYPNGKIKVLRKSKKKKNVNVDRE